MVFSNSITAKCDCWCLIHVVFSTVPAMLTIASGINYDIHIYSIVCKLVVAFHLTTVTLFFRMSASFFLSFYISSSVGFHNRLVDLFPSMLRYLFCFFVKKNS